MAQSGKKSKDFKLERSKFEHWSVGWNLTFLSLITYFFIEEFLQVDRMVKWTREKKSFVIF